ncbi:phosphotransferase [Streptomyces sp. 6N223]|uniref:phosphotransferase n=1 Tax=Streptomyces sp. 6N223 TaxID=3457412 RepID=UPI003FD1AF6B
MPLSARTLTALLRRYGAGEALACEPLTEGLLNRGYRLATTRGRFFLKHHLDDIDGDAGAASVPPLAEQHRATAALATLGLPVAPPLADRDGHTVAWHAGCRYALHPWVEGRHRVGGELTPPDCRRLGALLGRVHRGLEDVIGQIRGHVGPVAIPLGPSAAVTVAAAAAGAADPADTQALIDRLLARVRCRPRRNAFDALAEHRLQERRALLRAYAHRRPGPSQTPASGWVHGDFHPLNLLYRDERSGAEPEPAAIIDWDRLGIRPRAEEVVRAAAIFFLCPDGSLELPKVRAYARAYRHGTCTDPAEMAAAVNRVWWERLNDFWMLRWHYERGDHRADPQFPAASALVGWWTTHGTAVRDAFCD